MSSYNGPLHQMASTMPTQYLNDSCAVSELSYAIERGAIGATSNPVIVGNVLKKEMHLWHDTITKMARDNPTSSETQIANKVYEALSITGAKLLLPVYEASGGKVGRLSIQTEPALYNNAEAMFTQALHFASLAPNIQIKLPCNSAGASLIEELTYRGVTLNVTASFNVPQVLVIAEGIERGLKRRDAEGKDSSAMTPYATMMVGRNDDWMKVWVKKHGIDIDPAYLEWCGVACFKHAYEIYQQRGYRTQLLAAAYRNVQHWTEFVGGKACMTIPWDWQVKFNESGIKPEARMHVPVEPVILNALLDKIPEFRRSYEADGMSVSEFDSFGAMVRTLRSFIEGTHSFVGMVRDVILPNPDV
jgi:transaldolase